MKELRVAPIKDFENYFIFLDGTVSNNSFIKPRIKKPQIRNKYLQVCLCSGGKRHVRSIHRLMADAFIPNLEGKTQAHHKDGDKSNNNVENLEWVTPKEHTALHFK